MSEFLKQKIIPRRFRNCPHPLTSEIPFTELGNRVVAGVLVDFLKQSVGFEFPDSSLDGRVSGRTDLFPVQVELDHGWRRDHPVLGEKLQNGFVVLARPWWSRSHRWEKSEMALNLSDG